jgi:indolepyruvate ferredoxin oxidoreductase beta subunit
MNKLDLLMVGVGGQGIVLAGDILADVVLALGYDVKKTDTLGMAQRGGSVVSHIRVAPKVWSPLVKEGEAEVLLALEKLEAARWCHFLRRDGIAIVNDYALPPLSVSLGLHRYPSDEEIRNILQQRTKQVYFVNGTEKAKRLGEVRAVNMFMLGFSSCLLPADARLWESCIAQRFSAKAAEINVAAFRQGREEGHHAGLR